MIARLAIPGSDLAITRLGFGCARILGASEARASARLIEAALDAGIRHFDTAPAYGDGESEAVLGAVLRGVADVTVATKIGIPRPPPRAAGIRRQVYRRVLRPALAAMPWVKASLLRLRPAAAAPADAPRRRLDRDAILRGLDDSERQLGRRADIYLLHEPERLELDDGALATLAELQRVGRIGAYGAGTGAGHLPPGLSGSVAQLRIGGELPEWAAVAIYHGALRERRPGQTAGAHVAAMLAAYADAAIVFSASSPAQVSALAAEVAARSSTKRFEP